MSLFLGARAIVHISYGNSVLVSVCHDPEPIQTQVR